MNNPRISIIMPVYNSETTVKRSIESFIRQSFGDWELIVVNDGSTDNSLAILNEYSEQDDRIKVINKDNGGVASARQAGMDNMSGEYFIHADSDDWVEPTMLSDMIDQALSDNSDIVIADYYVNHMNGKQEIIRQRPISFDSRDVLYLIYAKKLFGGLWHKLIKKSVYDKVGARFFEQIDYCEDVLLLTQILSRPDVRISYIDKAYYHYILSENSLTRNISRRSFESLKRFTQLLPSILPEEERYKKVIRKSQLDLFVAGFMNNIYDSARQKAEYRKVKDIALTTTSIRWKMGYYCIDWGFSRLAHKLLHY